jgi:tetrahydromethanopterin S-methyltransferase subunit G
VSDNQHEPSSELNQNVDSRVLQALSSRLRELEQKIEAATAVGTAAVSIGAEDIQEISAKINKLTTIIDRVEVEISQLNSRIDDIESLRFRHRSRK